MDRAGGEGGRMEATQVNPLAYDAAAAIHQVKKAVQYQGAPNLADAVTYAMQSIN